MQGSVFLQLGPQSQVIGHGRIVGSVGKAGDFWLVEYSGRPTYRRVFGLEALTNFAIFANEKDRANFLNPEPVVKPGPPAGEAAPATPAAETTEPAAEAAHTEALAAE